jgi:hypothetical protein
MFIDFKLTNFIGLKFYFYTSSFNLTFIGKNYQVFDSYSYITSILNPCQKLFTIFVLIISIFVLITSLFVLIISIFQSSINLYFQLPYF